MGGKIILSEQTKAEVIRQDAKSLVETNLLTIEKRNQEYLVNRGQALIRLKFGIHFGPPWPGSDKPCLLLPGAEMINALMGVHPSAPRLAKEIFDIDKKFFYFRYAIDLIDNETDKVVATGIASCNSYEDKYRYRDSKPLCQSCGKELRKSKHGDEWYCWAKKGGCGATFPSNQIKVGGKVENPNPFNQINTIELMAQKRAHIKATRLHACLSGTFSQDDAEYKQGVEPINITPKKEQEPSQEPKTTPKGKMISICPSCGVEALHPNSNSKSGNHAYFCWKQKGGCGKNFDADLKESSKEKKDDAVMNPSKIMDIAKQLKNVVKLLSKKTGLDDDEVFRLISKNDNASASQIEAVDTPKKALRAKECINEADQWLKDIREEEKEIAARDKTGQ